MDSNPIYDQTRVAVIGPGSFGTAVANLLAENNQVYLYTRRPGQAASLQEKRFSSGQALHDNVIPTEDLALIARECYTLFPMVPSSAFREMIHSLAPYLRPDHILIHGTKGLDLPFTDMDSLTKDTALSREDVKTMSEVILDESVVVKVGCLAGPNLAREIAQGQPAATVVGSRFDEVINEGKYLLRSNRFQVYGSYDTYGIELAGVFKNMLAIASGIVRGLELGENFRALLITKGLSEIIHLGKVMGADPEAFLGLAGIGDIIATCSSTFSRNYTVGYRLAKGESISHILETMDERAEGVNTIRIAIALSNHYQLGIPIFGMLYQMLFEGKDPREGINRLMSLRMKMDVDFL